MARDTLRAEGRAQDDADRELGVDPADEGSPAASRSARPGKDRRGTPSLREMSVTMCPSLCSEEAVSAAMTPPP